jgi:hypothetical protein
VNANNIAACGNLIMRVVPHPKLKRDYPERTVRTTRPMSNGYVAIPAGSIAVITSQSSRGSTLKIKPCACCGMAAIISRIDAGDIEFIELGDPDARPAPGTTQSIAVSGAQPLGELSNDEVALVQAYRSANEFGKSAARIAVEVASSAAGDQEEGECCQVVDIGEKRGSKT